MTFTKKQIAEAIEEAGIVPLFTHNDPNEAQQMLEAVYKGGVRVFEFTNRTKNSYEIFTHLLKWANQYPDLILGIGTVMDAVTTKKFIDAGAHFIVSPIISVEMAEVCKARNILWIPGCSTVTEIVLARNNGATLVKIFPGSVLGPAFVSAVLPVVGDVKFMITGGVEATSESITAWFNAGATCVGLGSQLFKKEIIAEKNWSMLQSNVTALLQMVQQIKK